jgi:nucleoid DNA-binding protein
MRKTLPDLTKELSEKLEGISAKDVERVVEEFINHLALNMTEGEVVIRGFAKFFTSERKEKKARNPHTGEEIMVPARKVPRCKFSNSFSHDVKDGTISSLTDVKEHETDAEREWYVAINGKAEGPFGNSKIKKMLKDGKIKVSTLVYCPEAGNDWVALKDTELNPVPIPPTPPIPKVPPIPTAA